MHEFNDKTNLTKKERLGSLPNNLSVAICRSEISNTGGPGGPGEAGGPGVAGEHGLRAGDGAGGGEARGDGVQQDAYHPGMGAVVSIGLLQGQLN